MQYLPSAAIAIAALTALSYAQSTLVAPNGYASQVGTAGNSFPWSRGTSSMRIQFLYDSTHFTNQGVAGPIIISRLRYRADDGTVTTTWAGGSWPNVRIDMSTAAVDQAAASTTFANNHGADLTTVLNGPVTVTGGSCNGTGVPSPWYIDIPLANNFVYDPVTGSDLVVDIQLDGTGWSGTSRAADHVSSTGNPAPLGSRVYSSVSHTAATGTFAANYSAICEFSYLPATGLFPSFSATPTSGAAPLLVQFTDTSFSSDPGGVVAWQWDFNGDTVIDSTLQNPSFTYTACGDYNVSLTAIDTTHGPVTTTRNGFITVDPIAADFSASVSGGAAPLLVQFTDASTNATGWAWDFDNDSVVDSTLQNPTWVYAAGGVYSVRLAVTNACRSASITKPNMIQVVASTANTLSADLLELKFNEVRGQTTTNTASTTYLPALANVNTAGWQGDPGRPAFMGNEAGAGMLASSNTVANTNLVNTGGGLSLTGSMTMMWWDRQVATPPSTAYSFGGTGTAGVRIFTGGVAGTSLLYRGATLGGLSSGDVLATTNVQTHLGTWWHIALVIDDVAGTATWYFNGVADPVVPFTPNTHVAAITEVHVGYHTSTTSTYTAYYDMDDFRLYGRALTSAEITAAMAAENPTSSTFGSGCPGSLGVPTMAANSAPTLGNAGYALSLGNAQNGRLAALVLGFLPRTFGPIDLSFALGSGCNLEMEPTGKFFYVTAGNGVTQGLPIPVLPAISGMHVYGQWLVLDSTSGAASPAIDIAIR